MLSSVAILFKLPWIYRDNLQNGQYSLHVGLDMLAREGLDMLAREGLDMLAREGLDMLAREGLDM